MISESMSFCEGHPHT